MGKKTAMMMTVKISRKRKEEKEKRRKSAMGETKEEL